MSLSVLHEFKTAPLLYPGGPAVANGHEFGDPCPRSPLSLLNHFGMKVNYIAQSSLLTIHKPLELKVIIKLLI